MPLNYATSFVYLMIELKIGFKQCITVFQLCFVY